MSQLLPQIVIFIKNDFFTRVDASVVFVNIVLYRQKIVGHGLECQFMQEWTGDIEASVQDDELRLGLLLTLAHPGFLLLVGVESVQEYLCQVFVHPALCSVSYGGEL